MSNRGLHPPPGNLRRKPTIFRKYNHPNLSPCWDLTSSTYPDQTPQLAALIGAYPIRRETKNFQIITNQIYLHVRSQQILHTHIRHRNLLCLIGPSARKHNILSTITIQIYLHIGTQRKMSTQIRRRNLLRLIGVYIPRGKQTILSKQLSNLSICWVAPNNVCPDQTPQLVAPN